MFWTKEDCKKWLPFINAVIEGKTIQICTAMFDGSVVWKDFPKDTLLVTYGNHAEINPDNLRIKDDLL